MSHRREICHIVLFVSVVFFLPETNYSQVRNVIKSSVSELKPNQWEVTLDPKQVWLDTGIQVAKGDLLRISASGVVVWDKSKGNPNGSVGPDGTNFTADTLPGSGDFPLPSAGCGSLVMKIGNSVYSVGSELILRAENSGKLLFVVNDRLRYLSDNSGSFTANVKIVKPIQEANFKGIKVELIEARLRGGSVTFDLLVTAYEDRRGLDIAIRTGSEKSFVWDNLGNSYDADRGTFANNELNNRPWCLVTNVPTLMTVTFDDISPKTRSISRTAVVFWVTWPISKNSEDGEFISANFGSFALNQ